MSWSGPEFVLAIIAISSVAWVVTTWIRARHGYPVENEWSGQAHKGDAPPSARQIELIVAENAATKAQVSRLEERLAVMERIVTDPGRRVATEIDALR